MTSLGPEEQQRVNDILFGQRCQIIGKVEVGTSLQKEINYTRQTNRLIDNSWEKVSGY